MAGSTLLFHEAFDRKLVDGRVMMSCPLRERSSAP
jgi:hypothetical protein